MLRPSVVESCFEALRGAALTRLVDREEELDLLLQRWARARAGNGQIVVISGEPGLGKSRIIAALEERLHEDPHLRLRCFCSPYHQDSALFPLVDQLGRVAGFARDDTPTVKLEKLNNLLSYKLGRDKQFVRNRSPCLEIDRSATDFAIWQALHGHNEFFSM